MTLVSVTRARVRRLWHVPGFARHAVPAFVQAQRSQGFQGGSVLRDRDFTFWTLTMWDGMDSMRAYMLSDPHRAAMPKFVDWCDEASVVHWEQDDPALPTWPEAERRMRAEGRPSTLRHPSPHHATLDFRAARTTASSPIPTAPPRTLTGPSARPRPHA
jgi:hypothetical protein